MLAFWWTPRRTTTRSAAVCEEDQAKRGILMARERSSDLGRLDEALSKLAGFDARKLESGLRFFGAECRGDSEVWTSTNTVSVTGPLASVAL